jgi:hypothetical protein
MAVLFPGVCIWAEAWLEDFGVAVASGDAERIAGLFDEDGHILET